MAGGTARPGAGRTQLDATVTAENLTKQEGKLWVT
ncbi:MAG: hypothetical protein JWR37_4860 [Mycobacterium sp.]|nr:hypothetical protein [Mycobacterium sp.]